MGWLQKLFECIDDSIEKVDKAINDSNERDRQGFLDGSGYVLSKKRKEQLRKEWQEKNRD